MRRGLRGLIEIIATARALAAFRGVRVRDLTSFSSNPFIFMSLALRVPVLPGAQDGIAAALE